MVIGYLNGNKIVNNGLRFFKASARGLSRKGLAWVASAGIFWLLSTAAFAAPLEFNHQDVNGKSHSLSAERGNYVVINIWAS